MPQIDVHLIKDVPNPEQKKQVIEKLTDATVPMRSARLRRIARSLFGELPGRHAKQTTTVTS